jgi:hypothetical protein
MNILKLDTKKSLTISSRLQPSLKLTQVKHIFRMIFSIFSMLPGYYVLGFGGFAAFVVIIVCIVMALKHHAPTPTPPNPEYCPAVSTDMFECFGGLAKCGYLSRDMDPTGEVSGKIDIFYRFRERADKSLPSRGTLVGMTGGPGYGSTGTASMYEVHSLLPIIYDRLSLHQAVWGAGLLENYDTLTVDQRGTGCSRAINCPSVQLTSALSVANMSACGAQLGAESDLYGMQLVSGDVAAVLDYLALTAPIDLYGESYGTFAAQAFAGNIEP